MHFGGSRISSLVAEASGYEGLMHEVIFEGYGLVVTPWKLVGYLGVALFGGRWIVQTISSHKMKRPYFPGLFWYMSFFGSLCLLSYFIWGKNDSVGVLSNLMPSGVAAYNLYLHVTHRKKTNLEQEKTRAGEVKQLGSVETESNDEEPKNPKTQGDSNS